MNENVDIWLVASSGGHLSELLKLETSWDGYTVGCVTTTNVVEQTLRHRYHKVYVVGECNRNNPIRVLFVFAKCIRIVLSERPRVVISAGAAAGCIVCMAAKLLGAKVVWLDSITNVERPSLSGRLIRPFADLFLVQWPELAERYKGAEYVGAVI